MAGGFPILRAYRPDSTLATAPSVPNPIDTVLVPAPSDADRLRAAWIEEGKIWSQIRAQAAERYQQHQIEVEKAKAEYDQQIAQQAQEKAQDECDKKIAQQASSPVCYRRAWVVSIFGLTVSGFLFLSLFTNAFRDSKGGQVGVNTGCDLVPSLTDGSKFSVVYWTAVAIDFVSRSAAVLAVVTEAALSEGMYQDAVAHWKRLYEYSRIGNYAGGALATIPLHMLMVRGNCENDAYLNLGLATLAVMSWTLLASIAVALFLERGHRAILGQWKAISNALTARKQLREKQGKNSWVIRRQDAKNTLERV